MLDQAAYLARIDYKGPLEPTLETLKGLQFAHVSAIPFENLDIMLGKTISLDLPHLEAKLVKATAGRILLRAKRALRRDSRVTWLRSHAARGARPFRRHDDPAAHSYVAGSKYW